MALSTKMSRLMNLKKDDAINISEAIANYEQERGAKYDIANMINKALEYGAKIPGPQQPYIMAADMASDPLLAWYTHKNRPSKKGIKDADSIWYGTEDIISSLDESEKELLNKTLLDSLTSIGSEFAASSKFGTKGAEESNFFDLLFARGGGQVPEYYGGGSVQNSGTPTIAEYFERQGKKLDGSKTETMLENLRIK